MPEWEEFVDAEDYLNDEEKFNVTSRLVVLFPKIDVAPVDGFLSEGELTQWNMEQSQKEVLHRTEREMEVHDKDRDGFTLQTQRIQLLQEQLQEIRERDTDKDGKVSFKEFFRGLFDLVRNYDEEGDHSVSHHSEDSEETPARKMFAQLDKDGDGFLSDVELMPIIEKLHPSERYYAKQQADYIIQQADSDKDGRLTLTEVIENPYVFYSAVFNEDGNNEDYAHHDDFLHSRHMPLCS
ncbi:hypothetical protein Leryth_004454 [Lithospermum erythrorhizon]|nr:hypothetical protein Leryth_004454 [Lithospermum erythrorhizon]